MVTYHKAIPGKSKQRREDSHFFNDGFGIFLIADGLQGSAGNSASNYSTNNVGKELEIFQQNYQEEDSNEKVIKAMKESFARAHKGCKEVIVGGTTLDCLVLRNSKAYIGHVGDSATYAIHHNGVLEKLTTKDKGDPVSGPEHYLGDPTLKISNGPDSDLELLTYPAANVRYFLLATDGLTDRVNHDDLQKIVGENFEEPQQMLERLYEAATQAKYKKDDDTTMLLVDLEDTPSLVTQLRQTRADMEMVEARKRETQQQLDSSKAKVTGLEEEVGTKNRTIERQQEQITGAIDNLAAKYSLPIGDTTTLSVMIGEAGRKYDGEKEKVRAAEEKRVAEEQRAVAAEGTAAGLRTEINGAKQAFTAAGYCDQDLSVNVKKVLLDKVNAENRPPIVIDNNEEYRRRDAQLVKRLREKVTGGRILRDDLEGAVGEFITLYQGLVADLSANTRHDQAMQEYLDGVKIETGLSLATRVQKCATALATERQEHQADKDTHTRVIDAVNAALNEIDNENKFGFGGSIRKVSEPLEKAEVLSQYLTQKQADLEAVDAFKNLLGHYLGTNYNPHDPLRENIIKYNQATEAQLKEKEEQLQQKDREIERLKGLAGEEGGETVRTVYKPVEVSLPPPPVKFVLGMYWQCFDECQQAATDYLKKTKEERFRVNFHDVHRRGRKKSL